MARQRAVVVRDTRRGAEQLRAVGTRCAPLPPDLAPGVTLAVVEARDAKTVGMFYRCAGGGVADVTVLPVPAGEVSPGTSVFIEPAWPGPAAALEVWELVQVVREDVR
jgi:hypothetical protein